MSRNYFYLWILILSAILNYNLNPISTGDLSHYIALGADTLDQQKIIRADTYTFTETELNFIYPVLSSILFAIPYKIGNIELTLFFLSLIPLFWFFIWHRAFTKSHHSSRTENIEFWNKKTFILFLVSIGGSLLTYIPRCSLLASVLTLYAYLFIKKNEDKLYSKTEFAVLFFISLFWVNIHGSFLILSLMLVWSSLKYLFNRNIQLFLNRSLAVVFINIGALINPHFYKVYSYTLITADISKRRGITEWFSPFKFDFPLPTVLFLITSFYVIFLLTKEFKKKSFNLIFDPFFLFVIMGFTAIRNVYFIFLILPVFFSFNKLVDFELSEEKKSAQINRKINFILIVLMVITVFLTSPPNKKMFSTLLPDRFKNIYEPGERPPNILKYLNQNKDRIFNSWEFGSNLALARTGQYFIDTRNIIFSEKTFELYENFLSEPGKYINEISAYNIRFFLIHEKHVQALTWLNKNSSCSRIISEDSGHLFECKFQ